MRDDVSVLTVEVTCWRPQEFGPKLPQVVKVKVYEPSQERAGSPVEIVTFDGPEPLEEARVYLHARLATRRV